MAVGANERPRRDVGCPFCGLVCDDLTIDNAGDRLQVVAAGCALSRERFAAASASASPMVGGRPSDLSTAVARAAEILAASRAPVFVVASDVAGVRAALRLADRLGAVIDHPDSEALFRTLRVTQDAGALTTTLSEIRNRADLLLIVGPDPSPATPRFFERCIAPAQTLFADALQRQLFRLGPAGEAAAPAGMSELPCAMERLPEAVAALAAALRGRRIGRLDLPGLDAARLEHLAGLVKSARYGVVAWAPAMFGATDGALVAQMLLDLAREATRTTRCSIVALGGSGNLVGVNQVCSWQSGYPLRTAFGRGAPEHDSYRFAARRMVAEGEADALIWISAFDAEASPPDDGVPTVLLAPPGAAAARSVAAYLPVGIPGVDHAGQVFRTDGVVALRLQALRAAGLPDAAAMLGRIEERLGAGRTSR